VKISTWRASSSVCVARKRLLASSGAELISPDDAASHSRFRSRFGLPFVLLSDEDHATAEAWGAWGEKIRYGRASMGILRSTFLVDPDGRIARAWPKVRPEGHAAEVREALAAAREARG